MKKKWKKHSEQGLSVKFDQPTLTRNSFPMAVALALTLYKVHSTRVRSCSVTLRIHLVPVPKLQPALHPMWLTAPKVPALVSNFRIDTEQNSKIQSTLNIPRHIKTYRSDKIDTGQSQRSKVPSQEVTVPTIACSQFSLKPLL